MTPHRIATAVRPDAFDSLKVSVRDMIIGGSAVLGPPKDRADIVALGSALAR